MDRNKSDKDGVKPKDATQTVETAAAANIDSLSMEETSGSRNRVDLPRIARYGPVPVANRSVVIDTASDEELMDAKIAAEIVRERIALVADTTTAAAAVADSSSDDRYKRAPPAAPAGKESPRLPSSEQQQQPTGVASMQTSEYSVERLKEIVEQSADAKHHAASTTPRLQRHTRVIHQATPGAVRVTGMHATTVEDGEAEEEGDEEHQASHDLVVRQSPDISAPFEPTIPIEATLVASSHLQQSGHLYLEAQPMEETSKTAIELNDYVPKKRLYCGMMFAGLCLVATLVIGITVVVVMSNKNSGDSAMIDPATDLKTYPPYTDDLPPATVDQISNFPSSPQARANAWLVEDPSWQNQPPVRKMARFALATLYFATNGESDWIHKDHWLDYDVHECLWYSSHPTAPCDPQDRSPFRLVNLSSNALRGTIPIETVMFSTLDVSNNALVGKPPTVGRGNQLEVIVASNNQLAGAIAGEFGWSSSLLRVLRIAGNSLPGVLSDAFSPLIPNIEELDMSRNRFYGVLPNMNLPNGTKSRLREVNLAQNQFEGRFPESWQTLQSLQLLNVSGNVQLNGTIPEGYSSLLNLTLLDVTDTGVTGTIPGGLCELQQSGVLDIRADFNNVQRC